MINQDHFSQLPLSLVLAKMEPHDLADVLAIEAQAYSMPWPESAFRQALASQQTDFRTLKYQGQLIGYSGTWILADEVHIGTIATHPQLRGQGIGEFLLWHIVQHSIRQAMVVVTLEVRPSNQVARNLYTKYGFSEVGRRKRYYQDTGEDAIIMTTPLLDLPGYQAQLQQLAQRLATKLVAFNMDGINKLT